MPPLSMAVMTLSFPQLAHYAKHLLSAYFIFIWLLFCLIPVVVFGRWLSGLGEPIPPASAAEPAARRRSAWQLSLADGILGVVFLLFLTLYIILLFYKTAFAWYGDSQLIDYSLLGKPFPPPIWLGAGRFFPLGFQEFNLLMYVTKSLVGYYSFAAVQLLVLLIALLVALQEIKIRYRVLVLMALMLAPSFVVSFSALVYPERDVLFWLPSCWSAYMGTGRPKRAAISSAALWPHSLLSTTRSRWWFSSWPMP